LPASIDLPSKIVCVGLNYRDHAAEQNLEPPQRPMLFAKWPNSVIGPGDAIVLPPISNQVDYEAELGVVIGARVKGAAVENALEAIRGYVPLNDVSARDLQLGDGQFTRGKSLDTFCPIGELVPVDEVPDPGNLRIRCLINGETLQDSSTAQMTFGVADLVSFISEAITLLPGDVIATGTPAGVGLIRNPQRFLMPGDEVTVEIERVGSITNPVIASD
jgi:2-keto-4-pentenoate hydratase/2-oxohepta-3-ene-1,7-dioic acid hydratase in catechol pathway